MYDVIIIGGGHAGVEAALSVSRLNQQALMVLGSKNKIANLPCNPSIGGPAKGIIVREIDALGGEMGKVTDKTLIQIKMLNLSKGPAVRALRAQADKMLYPKMMREVLEAQQNLTLLEGYVVRIITEEQRAIGVELENGDKIFSKAVIIASGTYMASTVLVGSTAKEAGPDGERTTSALSQNLKDLGLELIRLKTGTPARIKKDSIDYSKVIIQPGDDYKWKFSYQTNDNDVISFADQENCYLTYTTPKTHQLIKDNIHLSSMYSGLVTGVGPRYCPSIEDKITRFADKDRHQIFLEPESKYIDEVYIQGFSTSMPHHIQEKMVKSLPGLEKAEIVRYAYAIEYDAINPLELKASLETKKITNLFFAGQVNGTSGYEEAACQGLMAGINATLKIKNEDPFVLRRDEAYIGVLIDDLITKGVKDPYRLLTSRAEFRLLLRHDNADSRLTKYGYKYGLIKEERYQKYLNKKQAVKSLTDYINTIKITPKPVVNEYLIANGKNVINEKLTAYDFLKRPDIDFIDLECVTDIKIDYNEEIKSQVLIEIKYDGYIQKAYKEAKKAEQMEARKIPQDFNYKTIGNLAKEACEKLEKIKPETIGQASRISGVNPSDIAILLLYLESRKKHD